MSLATRCSSCGTVFRVVQDQLKVSEGWVRCGRCSSVFNALEGLFDLGRDAPPDWHDEAMRPRQEPASTPARHGEPERSAPESADADPRAPALPQADTGTPSSLDDSLAADRIDAKLFRNRRAERAPQAVKRDRLEFSDARFDSDLFEENPALAEPELAELHTTASGELPLEHAVRPDFLRRAERRARWRSTPMRLALATTLVVASAALLLQVAHHYRDTAAAHWPGTRPALLAWCRVADCSVEAPRHIDDVTVESTALTRAAGVDAFVLSVNLRSRSPIAVALPSIDLSLTDGNGRLVARRALSPRDFRASAVLPPGADAALQLTLAARALRVAGYTVELFYP
ncbi:MAG: zinc-ribbon and DUF3426 domain-containing protein [Caldimonas sp.]